MTGKRLITLHVNGDAFEVLASPRQTLLDVIRDGVGLTGTKEGCAAGTCGVCTINNARGESLLSCITPALEWDRAAGARVHPDRDHRSLRPVRRKRGGRGPDRRQHVGYRVGGGECDRRNGPRDPDDPMAGVADAAREG